MSPLVQFLQQLSGSKLCQHCLSRLAVPGFALRLCDDGGWLAHLGARASGSIFMVSLEIMNHLLLTASLFAVDRLTGVTDKIEA